MTWPVVFGVRGRIYRVLVGAYFILQDTTWYPSIWGLEYAYSRCIAAPHSGWACTVCVIRQY